MPCTRSNGVYVNDQFYDRVDEQGQSCFGVWHWASRCPMCDRIVYERVESLVADTFVRIDATSLMSIF